MLSTKFVTVDSEATESAAAQVVLDASELQNKFREGGEKYKVRLHSSLHASRSSETSGCLQR